MLDGLLYAASPRTDWATLLRRTFEVDVLACSRCGGRLRVLACLTDGDAVRRFLTNVGLPTDAPSTARARDPTEECDLDEASAAD